MQAVGSVGLLQAKVIIARNAIVICQCDLCHAMLRYVMRFFSAAGHISLGSNGEMWGISSVPVVLCSLSLRGGGVV